MNNKKLSKLLLGSALVLGLGASTGSFAQAQAQISESAAALIAETPALKSAAQSLLGAGQVFTGTAAQIAAISQLASDPSNAEGARFASMLKNEEVNGQPWYMRSSMKARAAWNGFKVAVVAFVAAANIGANAAQTAGTGLSSPLAKQVLGNSAIECVKEWKDPTATNSAAIVLATIGESQTVSEFQNKAVEKVRTANFPTETHAQVKQRLADAMNSEHCDIIRVEGVRPARPL
jgi:hypothetical protein